MHEDVYSYTVEREMVSGQEAACTRQRKANEEAAPLHKPGPCSPLFGWWISKLIVIYQAKGFACFN